MSGKGRLMRGATQVATNPGFELMGEVSLMTVQFMSPREDWHTPLLAFMSMICKNTQTALHYIITVNLQWAPRGLGSIVEQVHLVSWLSVVKGDWTRVALFCCILCWLLFWVVFPFVYQYQSSDWLWDHLRNNLDCVRWGIKIDAAPQKLGWSSCWSCSLVTTPMKLCVETLTVTDFCAQLFCWFISKIVYFINCVSDNVTITLCFQRFWICKLVFTCSVWYQVLLCCSEMSKFWNQVKNTLKHLSDNRGMSFTFLWDSRSG